MQSPSIRFAAAVQALACSTRALGLTMPGFRSPPRLVGVQRSIKRSPGGATVAVVVRGRPWAAVQADLVEGVVAANALRGSEADRARAALWLALEGEPEAEHADPGVRNRRSVRPHARPAGGSTRRTERPVRLVGGRPRPRPEAA